MYALTLVFAKHMFNLYDVSRGQTLLVYTSKYVFVLLRFSFSAYTENFSHVIICSFALRVKVI